jgi:hypothetical protein
MRLKFHRSAQTKVVVFGDETLGVEDSAYRLDRFTIRRPGQQFRHGGQIDPQVKSGVCEIRFVVQLAAVVTFGVRSIVELNVKRTAVDCASIPD